VLLNGCHRLPCAPATPHALALRLGHLASDEARATQLGLAGRARATSLFTWAGVARQLCNVYRDALASVRATETARITAVAGKRKRAKLALVGPSSRACDSGAISGGKPESETRQSERCTARALYSWTRTGTLLDDVAVNVDPARMRFARGAGAALTHLASLHIPLIVVSNQAGMRTWPVHRGGDASCRKSAENACLRECGATLTDFYYCPHDLRPIRRTMRWHATAVSRYQACCYARPASTASIRRARG
jgi:hypothetical protein